MAEYKVLESTTEVRGEGIQAFSAGFPRELRASGWKILEKHQIGDIRGGEWYPLQNYLDAMKEIADSMGHQMLVRIGEQIATSATLPPELNSLEAFFQICDEASALNHKGDVGHYISSDKGIVGGLRVFEVNVTSPYPCSFDRGVLEGFAKRFKPKEARDIIVRHDESRSCRKTGGDSCTYIVSWG